jgi:hypothetical protein
VTEGFIFLFGLPFQRALTSVGVACRASAQGLQAVQGNYHANHFVSDLLRFWYFFATDQERSDITRQSETRKICQLQAAPKHNLARKYKSFIRPCEHHFLLD